MYLITEIFHLNILKTSEYDKLFMFCMYCIVLYCTCICIVLYFYCIVSTQILNYVNFTRISICYKSLQLNPVK